MTFNNSRILAGAALALFTLSAQADEKSYLLRPAAGAIERVVQRYHLRVLQADPAMNLYVVEPVDDDDDLGERMHGDTDVQSVEEDQELFAPEIESGSMSPTTDSVTAALGSKRLVAFEDSYAWQGFLTQPAVSRIGLDASRARGNRGAGLVAVIDSGIDAAHPVLRGAVVAGYDFTRDAAGGATELIDISASDAAALGRHQTLLNCTLGKLDSTTAFLDSTTAFLDSTTAFLDSTTAFLDCSKNTTLDSTTAFLDSTTAFLDSTTAFLDSTTAFLDQSSQSTKVNNYAVAALPYSVTKLVDTGKLPTSFGHGTMVASLVRLVAPGASIMPVRAFEGDGSSSTYNLVRAIRYATDNGADIINMSFSLTTESPELRAAIRYAAENDVTMVSSAGNSGNEVQVFPAIYDEVLGVASTNSLDQRSGFSNYGVPLVSLAAPGQGVVAAYPGGNYAAAWGTSFSTALVSGALALRLENTYAEDAAELQGELLNAVQPLADPKLGAGRLSVAAW